MGRSRPMTPAEKKRVQRAKSKITTLVKQGYRLNEPKASPYYVDQLNMFDPLRTKGRQYPKPKTKR